MKNIFVTIVLLLAFAVSASAQERPGMTVVPRESEEAFIQHVYRSTVLLYAQDSKGSMQMLCTGTVFGKTATGYRVVTAAHCTSTDDTNHERVKTEPSTFFVTFDESAVKEFIIARVVVVGYQHRGDDFTILEIDTQRTLSVVDLGDESLDTVGSEVLNVASPLGLGRQVFKGFISMQRLDRPVIEEDINWKNAMLIQLNVGGGSSGSAVISVKQRAIIAFLVGSISRGASPNVVAIPVSKFKDFIKMWEAKKYKWFIPDATLNE